MLDRGQEHSDRWAVVGYAVHPPRRGMIVNEKSTAKRSERETLLLLYSMHHQEVSEEEIFFRDYSSSSHHAHFLLLLPFLLFRLFLSKNNPKRNRQFSEDYLFAKEYLSR